MAACPNWRFPVLGYDRTWLVAAATLLARTAAYADPPPGSSQEKTVVTTYAGRTFVTNDGGPPLQARFAQPEGLALDPAGNLLIADSLNKTVRKVDFSLNRIDRVVGTGVTGYNGDGLPADVTMLGGVRGLRYNADGDLYLADIANHRVRKWDHTTKVILPVAGTG